MNQLYKDMLAVVYSSLHNQPLSFDHSVDWAELSPLIRRSKLLGTTFNTVSQLPEGQSPDADILSYWKQTVFQLGMKQLLALQELKIVLTEAAKRNLNLILFKGIALAQLYPEPNMRFSCDTDLLVSEEHRPLVEKMLLELGYTACPSSSKDHVPVFLIDQGPRRLKIELHDCLWEDYTGKQAENLDSLHLSNVASLIHTEACGLNITTLGYNEHLIYQVFHIAKHFSFEGLPLRYLTDLVLYINSYIDKLDLVQFWDAMKLLQYDDFCRSLFQIGITHLGMNATIMKGQTETDINEEFLKDILLAGQASDGSYERWQSTDLLVSYFMHENKMAQSEIAHKISLFFPLPSQLKDKFSYAKKCPILLPFAWIHRFFSALHYSIICKKKGISSTKVLDKAEYRLSLMKSLGLVEQ